MIEEDLETMLDEAIRNIEKNKLFLPNPNNTETVPVDLKLASDTFQENLQYYKQCEITTSDLAEINSTGVEFLCYECNKTFADNLIYGTKKNVCSLCRGDEDLTLQHLIEHQTEFLFCEICNNRNLNNLTELRKHLYTDHSFIFYNCFCCDDIFQLKYSIICHMIFVHKLNKKENMWKHMEYKCVQCNETFNDLSEVQLHIQSTTKHMQINCTKDVMHCLVCKKQVTKKA